MESDMDGGLKKGQFPTFNEAYDGSHAIEVVPRASPVDTPALRLVERTGVNEECPPVLGDLTRCHAELWPVARIVLPRTFKVPGNLCEMRAENRILRLESGSGHGGSTDDLAGVEASALFT